MTLPDNGSLSEMVEEALELSRENNRILKAMRRDAIIGGILQFVFWIVIIGASFYFSAMFLEPYLTALQGMQTKDGGGVDYGALIEQYKGLIGQ